MEKSDYRGRMLDASGSLVENQVRGQTSFDQNGEIYDEPQKIVRQEIIDVDDVPKTELKALIKGNKFDIRKFHEKFEDNSEELLYELMGMQDNAAPLKRGGPEVAFRCDVFILRNRQDYSVHENTVFDLITGYVSSFPDDKAYVITMKDIKKILDKDGDDKYIYRVIKEGVEGLKSKPLEFEYTDDKGRKRVLATPWYKLLTYDKESDNDNAYISFTPMPLFKALTISATVTHGAYYSSRVSHQISTKLTRSLYYFLESRKNYRAYPGASPGDFKISLEDFKEMLGLSESYKYGNIKARILDRAKEDFDNIQGIDFSFIYEPVMNGKKVEGIHFIITGPVVDSEAAAIRIEENEFMIEKEYLEDSEYSPKEIEDILKKYKKNERDRKYLRKVIKYVDEYPDAKSRVALMCKFMDETLKDADQKKSEKKQIRFNDFRQRGEKMSKSSKERLFRLEERMITGQPLSEEEKKEYDILKQEFNA